MNTAILLVSSGTVHWALHSIKKGNRRALQVGLAVTFLLGTMFLITQINEYFKAGFSIEDGAFASVFYGLTGLHGAHVFVGLTLLAIMNIRTARGHFTPDSHMGVEAAGDLLALRRRDVDHRVVHGLHFVGSPRGREAAMINPLKSEEDAFRFTLIVVALLAPVVIVAIVVQHGRRAGCRRRARARARRRPVRPEARGAAREGCLRPRRGGRHAPHPRRRERDALGQARCARRSPVARTATAPSCASSAPR